MLTSLPSLLIIPFVLLSGKLSEGRDKLKILIVGLSIFFLSGVACLFARSMAWLIVISCILGVGAGMVIPLSTGLIVDYFTGDSRVRQLGYSSAINNLTLVVATAVTGYLAEVNWHLPFLVYTLPGISLALSFLLGQPLHARAGAEHPDAPQTDRPGQARRTDALLLLRHLRRAGHRLLRLVSGRRTIKISPEPFSGVLISLFFLAIMASRADSRPHHPRVFEGRYVNLVPPGPWSARGCSASGSSGTAAMLVVGASLAGFGYGLIQPAHLHDKAATIAPPRSATLALSFVMAMNYLAVMICPFIMDMFRHLFHTHSDRFPFFFNAALVFALAAVTWFRRGNFTRSELDESYYKN